MSGSRAIDARVLKRVWYWILPSESREKSSQKLKSPCAGAPQHMYSSPKPTTETLSLATHSTCIAWLLSEQPEPQSHHTTVQPARTGFRIIALGHAKMKQNLVCEPMAVRSQSSSGNCFDTPSSHFRTVTRPARCVARLAREIELLFSFPCPHPRFGWLRRAGMSRSLGSLRRTVTLSSLVVRATGDSPKSWRSGECLQGPAIVW